MDKSVKKNAVQPIDSEVPERASWGRPLEFILSCLNYAVGLGNVWRFPYLVYRNGGGVFLIPYVIMLFTMGLPIFLLEMVVGQYSSLGPNTVFYRMAPIFHGLGYCSLIVIAMITINYQIIVTWTMFYTWASFDSELGWGRCDHDFNTADCYSQAQTDRCRVNVTEGDTSTYVTFYNQSCQLMSKMCGQFGLKVLDEKRCYNDTGTFPLMTLVRRVLASEEYYNDYAMGIRGANWDNWGSIRWEMVLLLFLSWVILYFCVIKGVATMGKVVYFTTAFPFIMLTALLIRGVTLPGAYDGILYYMGGSGSGWEYLGKASVWGDAASQTFYALGIGCGSLITLASYNKFDNNCHRDAIIVGLVNMLTSVFAGFVVFSILGFLANQLGVPVSEVVTSGPGLAFIAYPEAVLQMPLPHVWAILFFVMMFILGLGSQFGAIEAINTLIIDKWPWLRKYNYLVTLGTCSTCFFLGIPVCFQGGVFLFTLMDWNTAAWGIVIIGIFEVMIVAWVYGANKFLDNLSEMSINLPHYGRMYWSVVLKFISPICLFGVLGYTLYDYTPAYYGNYTFPKWVDVIGWLIGGVSLLPLPILAIYHIYKNNNDSWASWRDLFRPTPEWGPATKPLLPGSSDPQIQQDNLTFEKENNLFRMVQENNNDFNENYKYLGDVR